MITSKRIIAGLFSAALLSGCGVTIEQPDEKIESKGQPVGGTIHTDTFTQGDLIGGYADILFVVDDSGSMYDDQVRLGNAFDTFINWVDQESVDYHIAVTTTDMSSTGPKGAFAGSPSVIDNNTPDLVNAFKNNVMVGTYGSGTELGFEPALAGLTDPLKSNANAGFLRDNAKLYVVFVSDEDDQSPLTVPEYLQAFQDLKADPGQVHFSAIAMEANAPCGGTSTESEGVRYAEMIDSTGGLFGSICDEDFGTTLQQLAFEVTSASGEYFLTQIPVPETIQVSVEGTQQTSDRWTYHPATNSVEIHEGYIPNPGEQIVITYEIYGTGTSCLANGEVVYDLDGGEESWKYYCVEVPEGTEKLLVHLWNGRGDADLYLKLGSEPAENDYDHRSVIEGLDETLLIETPAAGTYHIGVYGFVRYEDVNLQPIYIGGGNGGGNGLDQHLVLSQVSYDTPGADGVEESIDLFNPTQSAVNLEGWTITDNNGTWSFPAGASIAPGAYLTVARDAAGFTALYGKSPDIGGLTLNLGNSGDWLMLNDLDGEAVDFVAWEGAATDWNIAAPTGSSIERADPSMDTDRESDWVVLTPAAPRGGV